MERRKNSKVCHSATPSVKASEEVTPRGPSLRTLHDFLDHELFDGILKILNLGLQLATLIAGDGTCNDRSCDATCSAKCLFRRNKNIGNILIFSKQWKMKEDLEWLSISCQHDEFRHTPVQCLRSFIGALLELLVVGSLLNEVQYCNCHLGIRQGVCFGVHSFTCHGGGRRVLLLTAEGQR